ncbi:Uncharacterised protein [Candidatus Burarchaeum australiense]|nr:Uncharacterised protein [Candidatus Burarchaeum australiense]
MGAPPLGFEPRSQAFTGAFSLPWGFLSAERKGHRKLEFYPGYTTGAKRTYGSFKNSLTFNGEREIFINNPRESQQATSKVQVLKVLEDMRLPACEKER